MRLVLAIIFGFSVAATALAQIEHRERQGTHVIPTNRLTSGESVNVTGSAVAAQSQPVCLHDTNETPVDAARRQDAIRVMRAINTAQAQAFKASQTYLNFRNLTDLGLPSRPTGFLTQLTVEGSTYALLLRDTMDPCRYTLFSDQEGVIYVGAPLQP